MTGETGYEAGTFILDSTTSMIPGVLPGDILSAGGVVMLIMWSRTTAFDVLESHLDGEADNTVVDITEMSLRVFQNFATSLNLQLESESLPDESSNSTFPASSAMTLKLDSVVPLPAHMKTENYYLGKATPPSVSSATGDSASIPMDDENPVDVSISTEGASSSKSPSTWKLDLALLKESYSEIVHADRRVFDELVATEDVLQIMGYVTRVEFSGFSDTGALYWKTLKMPSRQINGVQSESCPTPITPTARMTKLDLEDGEEEEDDSDDGLPPMAKSESTSIKMVDRDGVLPLAIHNKFCKEAAYYFGKNLLDDQVSNDLSWSLPLDMCSIDCEMCSTKIGLELTRITVVHPSYGIVLDSLVKPKNAIVDYHTEFSGVTKEHLQNVSIV